MARLVSKRTTESQSATTKIKGHAASHPKKKKLNFLRPLSKAMFCAVNSDICNHSLEVLSWSVFLLDFISKLQVKL